MIDTVYLVYCDEGYYEYDECGVSDNSYSEDKLIAAFSSKEKAADYCSQMPYIYTETEEDSFYSEQWRRYYIRNMPVN